MREIEIKAQVTNKAKLLNNLAEQQIVLSDPIEQHDVVYGVENSEANEPGSVWLRLRTENNTRTILTLKKQHRGGLDSIEHETVVADASEAQNIIQALGFMLYSDLTKTRQKAKVGQIEICLDEVQDLGCFLEAEILAEEDANGQEIEDTLWNLVSGFGIDRADAVHQGYDVLLENKHKLEA